MIGDECRRVLRSPAVWAALMLLLIAGTWGAQNTVRLQRDQAADLARMANAEARWYQDIQIRSVQYSRPGSTDLPYWQDPTDAAGFSRYFLKRVAAKPHLPLSVLSVGQSDLQPFAVPLRLETLFGGDRTYDFEPPRGLATGPFDASFVLVFVLPLCLGAAAATIGAQERDQRILPLVAAQPIGPRRWWSVRLGALMAVLVPGVAACVVVALAVAGAPVVEAWPETLAATALVAAHALFWLAVAGGCLPRGQGSVSTASSVAGVWLVLTVAIPIAGTVAARVAVPRPSPVADVNELRKATDAVQAEADAVVARRLIAHAGPDVQSVNPATLDYSTRLVLITEEMEERLAAQDLRRHEHREAGSRIARALWWLSPQIALHAALSDLAGTGSARHEAFVSAVRDFQLELRAFMYPRVLRQAHSSKPRACEACPGRLNFGDYDGIPRFTMPDVPPASRVASAVQAAGWLSLVAAVVAAVGVGRARRWRVGDGL